MGLISLLHVRKKHRQKLVESAATEVSAQSPGGKRQREPLCGQMLSVGGPLGGNRRSAIHPLQSTEGYNSCSVGSWGRRICLNKTTGLSEWEHSSQRLWAPSKDIQIDNHLVSGQSTDKIETETVRYANQSMHLTTSGTLVTASLLKALPWKS